MREIKLNLRQMTLIVAMLFPLSTIVERYVGFLNKLLLVVLCGILTISVVVGAYVNRKLFAFLVWVVCTFAVALIVTPIAAIKVNPNMAIYYVMLIFYFAFFINYKQKIFDDIIELKNFIFILVSVYTIFLTLTIFLPNSYIKMTAGGWGDELYFASFSKSPNRVGPACLFILVLILFLILANVHRNLLLLYVLPHLYVGFMGGSRTYLVLIAMVSVIIFYYWLDNKKLFFMLLIPIAIVAVIIIMKSTMMTKITISLKYINSNNKKEFWRRLSNSRSVLWTDRINAYSGFGIFNKIFGHGVNYTSYVMGLWSHNDFIEIIISYGLIGLCNYLIMIYWIRRTFKGNNIPGFIKFIIWFIWFFNAFFNFFYCYFNSMLCYPLLLIIMANKEKIQNKLSKGEIQGE